MALKDILDNMINHAALDELENETDKTDKMGEMGEMGETDKVDKIGENALNPQKSAVSGNKNAVALEQVKNAVSATLPERSRTESYKDYRNVVPMDEFMKQRGYKSWAEVAKDYGTQPAPEDAKRRQNRQNWLALAKTGAAGLSQIADIIGQKGGASVRLKHYDLGEENLQEGKREEALYQARLQDYFKKGEAYNKAMRDLYNDYSKDSAVRVSETNTGGKTTVSQENGIKQVQKYLPRQSGGSGSAKNGVVSGTIPYLGVAEGKHVNAKVNYSYDKNSKTLDTVYGILERNKGTLVSDFLVSDRLFQKDKYEPDRMKDVQFTAISECVSALLSELDRIDETKLRNKNLPSDYLFHRIEFINNLLTDIYNSGFQWFTD